VSLAVWAGTEGRTHWNGLENAAQRALRATERTRTRRSRMALRRL
jgi:hypothetical protein